MTDQPLAVDLNTLIDQGEVEAPIAELDEEGRVALANAGTPFTVNTITFGDDPQFGPYWTFEITADGKPATFRLPGNDKRDKFISSLSVIVAKQPVSGVRLFNRSPNATHPYLVLGPVVAE